MHRQIHSSHTSDLTTHRDGSVRRLGHARIVVAVDLSAVIFVVLALAWAVYLIPKALKHHDEMASDRLLEGHSDRVRILSRKARAAAAEVADAIILDAPAKPEEEHPAPAPEAQSHPDPLIPTREAARTAARRRRRVLGVLVLLLAVVWALTWFAYLPIWAPAVPGALVVAWLVIARLSVRKQQRRRRRAPAPVVESTPIEERREMPPVAPVSNADEFLEALADEEDTTGIDRQEIEAALAEEGSLWDPLPMTLPTYVSKARARRTVRTIELTGISSSGHDDTDSALAREAAETVPAAEESEARRKAAGA